MATIRSLGFVAQLRSEASSHVIRYRNGREMQSGRGLVFWFVPETASIAELPMDDREMTLFVKGRSQDFQTVAVQGTIGWHVVDPARLAERVDFSIDLRTGKLRGEPIEKIQARIAGIANQAVQQYLGQAPVRALLDAGPAPLRERLQALVAADPALTDIGVAAVAVRLTNLTPTSELERALQTPTFEALQQKADEATFQRRALAVEKERAIAENELANKTELARREKLLIAEEAENARNRATGAAEAQQIEAGAEAERIRAIEGAKAEAERQHIAIYRDLPPAILLGLAAQQLAGKLDKIEHVNVTPDLLATVLGEFRKVPAVIEGR
ncbi:band 7 protein [Mesorhizobium sp. M2A.F.Ca.ET.043.05.1.1]|uniref:SPFH domain-containing protein n=1 Tax=Mesorhizobium sp. M2A.F.Ca.ET.043.05.1.1 TaxID=2493671 RepID=UPI000F755B31|nr:SPFH domain-containing protein [Mesorhizobium sp. M2A.F.Ca.ET.043.05.1.1]AZO17460.1 band 7 protein [Mesorhizobium sp. M2A.F.Ca.ET.043.05.1.1]